MQSVLGRFNVQVAVSMPCMTYDFSVIVRQCLCSSIKCPDSFCRRGDQGEASGFHEMHDVSLRFPKSGVDPSQMIHYNEQYSYFNERLYHFGENSWTIKKNS